MFSKLVTEQYPEEKQPTAPRFHGRHQLNRHPDGLEKCIGCELCAWACPADAIYVEGAATTPRAERYSPGERYGRVYQINYLRCIFCGLCIEACPTRALTMTNEYELADDNRAALIFEKEDLLAPLLAGMVAARRTRWCPGDDEQDYYRGKVTRPCRRSSAGRRARRGDGDERRGVGVSALVAALRHSTGGAGSRRSSSGSSRRSPCSPRSACCSPRRPCTRADARRAGDGLPRRSSTSSQARRSSASCRCSSTPARS